jgi:ABC-2 type transport system ATP-binding protein
MAERPALEAFGLVKHYRDRHAVSGVDLTVHAGEVRGLLGPNGAGKTTLLRLLLGLVRSDAGTVSLLGQSAAPTGAAVPRGVAGFVEAPRFYPYLSGRRNLRLLTRLDGTIARSREADRIDELLAEVGLTGDADAKVGAYSAGMRQRLGLAAALLRSPRLLLLDEPTSGLDPAGARRLRDHIRRLAADGAAVLLSSHDMAEVEGLCSSLTILHHGRTAFSGTVEELRSQAKESVHRLQTSDDDLARAVAQAHPDVDVTAVSDGEGLEVRAAGIALDRYVIALGRAGVAVRILERLDRSLESLFLRLTAVAEDAGPSTATLPPLPVAGDTSRVAHATPSRAGVRAVLGVECAKLMAQPKTWTALAACAACPFVFVGAMKAVSSLPEDTLFGRWVNASGFAVPLVVLGFAASWGFPALTSVVAGDLFSAEDRYGTWSTLLTRGRTRAEVFAGKLLTAIAFALVAMSVLAFSSAAAGLLLVGRQPLVGLSGTQLTPGQSLTLIAMAWSSVLPPVFGFTALAVLLSVATRSSAAGIGLPVVCGLVMELVSAANGPIAVRQALLTPPFVAWHGLFTAPRYYGPLVHGTAVSLAYLVACSIAAHLLLRRRDLGG